MVARGWLAQKPWLDTALAAFKGFWTKYAPVEDELVQQCNIDIN